MPRKYHPNIRSQALKLIDQGYTAEQVLDELGIIYGEGNVPKQRETVYAWKKKQKEKGSNTLHNIGGVSNNIIESVGKLIPPPSLTELLERKVPKERALSLLSEWEAAYESGRVLSTMALDSAAALFAEFPDIPYDVAMAISSFEVRVRFFDTKDVQDLGKFMKRYRPWEGSENRKLMMRAFRQWCETRFDRRQ